MWPPQWHGIFGRSGGGPVDLAAVAAKDAGLAILLSQGITMEVLSWKCYKEEPSVCSLIS